MEREILIHERYIDFIPDAQDVILWGFSTTDTNTESVFGALVQGLADISRSERAAVRKRFFFAVAEKFPVR